MPVDRVNANSSFLIDEYYDRRHPHARRNYIIECVDTQQSGGTYHYRLQNASWNHDKWYTADDVRSMLRIGILELID